MSVIDTIKWLKETPKQVDICKKLRPYFNRLNEADIAKYLHSFGMFNSYDQLDKWIETIENEKIFAFITEEERKLQKEWNGPNISIFIFPCDQNNRKIKTQYKGRSGLAFKNKLFLFISLETERNDIKSLFFHEYHHVCRLANLKKEEKNFTIIDTMIMEGLAENAVREKLGEENIAFWTALYSAQQCERFFERMIFPQRDMTRENHKFTQLMYGTGFYPNMLGYAVGYNFVKSFMKQTGKKTTDILSLPSEEFIEKYLK
jgi:uncharacterized protein YjaZ